MVRNLSQKIIGPRDNHAVLLGYGNLNFHNEKESSDVDGGVCDNTPHS